MICEFSLNNLNAKLKCFLIGSQLPHCAASCFTWSEEEAYFILSYLSGDLLLIKQLKTGSCVSVELKFESIVPRFLYGLAEKFR